MFFSLTVEVFSGWQNLVFFCRRSSSFLSRIRDDASHLSSDVFDFHGLEASIGFVVARFGIDGDGHRFFPTASSDFFLVRRSGETFMVIDTSQEE